MFSKLYELKIKIFVPQFNLFSNATSNIIVPLMNEKMEMKSKTSSSMNHQSVISVDWLINVNELDHIRSNLTSLNSFKWLHGDFWKNLPHKIW